MTRRRAAMPAIPLVVLAMALGACGEQGIELTEQRGDGAQIRRGAELFVARCAGCHTLSAAGAHGSAASVHDVERTDGPNFDQRQETVEQVLYAIRNGGFSGAIMPQNIVVGDDARAVAEFVARYSGTEATAPPTPDRPGGEPTGGPRRETTTEEEPSEPGRGGGAGAD